MNGRTISKRLEALEAEQRGPEKVHCILLYEGQTHEEAFAIHEVAHGAVNDPDRSDLYVYICEPAPAPGTVGSDAP